MYAIIFFAGAAGFVLMTLLGFAHGAGARTHSGHAGASHGPAAGHGAGHGHAGAAHGHAQSLPSSGGRASAKLASAKAAGGAVRHWASSTALLAISPLDLFSFALGAGLTGSILSRIIGPTPTLVAAIGGALLFDFAVVKPLIQTIFNFAAPPSEGLEGMVSQSAIAATAFDRAGQGLISMVLDGQTIQLLGKLDNSEIESGARVAKGDTVIILEVDAKRNFCRVSRDLSL